MTYDTTHRQRLVDSLTAGVWLIGIGVLFATGSWWPGVLFLIGITAIFQGWLRGHHWQAIHGGFWAIFIGIWALMGYSMALFFVALGLWVILAAFLRPVPFQKPSVDNRLE